MTQIRLSKQSDIQAILAFIEKYWKADHVFTRRRDLFDWQHAFPGSDDIAFVLGLDDASGEILGLLGYIPVRRYDESLPSNDLSLAIWKVRDDCDASGLGLFLFKYLLKQEKPDFIGVIGLSDMVVPIYRALKFQTGLLGHFVFFNDKMTRFRIARGVSGTHKYRHIKEGRHFSLVHVGAAEELAVDVAEIDRLFQMHPPVRSWTYLCNRYLASPYYNYTVSLLMDGSRPMGGFVWRKIKQGEGACLRIVDFFGASRALQHHEADLQKLLEMEEAEYIDIQQVGMPDEDLLSGGFVDRRAETGLMVPHYFEPFVEANSELDYAFRVFGAATEAPPILLRGFCDQDRPNRLAERGACGAWEVRSVS